MNILDNEGLGRIFLFFPHKIYISIGIVSLGQFTFQEINLAKAVLLWGDSINEIKKKQKKNTFWNYY